MAYESGSKYSDEYRLAEPFPHVVLDNFLPELLTKKVLLDFPSDSPRVDGLVTYEGGYTGLHKSQFDPNYLESAFSRRFFAFLNSAPVLRFLEGLSGLNGLISDPYFTGAGYHAIRRGGLLGIHADHRIDPKLSLHRRLNLLLYLNENWYESYHGALELWDQKMTKCVRSIEPIFNRCVIFGTDANTFHGHPHPLQIPTNVSRKSIALYYYTASKSIYQEIPNRSTFYHAVSGTDRREKIDAAVNRIKQYVKDWIPPILYRLISSLRSTR